MIDTLNKLRIEKREVEVETTIAQYFYDIDEYEPNKTKGVFKGRIIEVKKDCILLKIDDYFDKNTKMGYSYYPELIRIDKIVSIHRVNNCEIIKKKK